MGSDLWRYPKLPVWRISALETILLGPITSPPGLAPELVELVSVLPYGEVPPPVTDPRWMPPTVAVDQADDLIKQWALVGPGSNLGVLQECTHILRLGARPQPGHPLRIEDMAIIKVF